VRDERLNGGEFDGGPEGWLLAESMLISLH
jgi:hypothetical protein